MNDDEISLLREQNDLMVAVCAALTPPTPPPEDPPARMTEAEFIADLANIAAGRRADAFRQRQITPGGSAAPPAADGVSRRDPAAFLSSLASIAAGKTRVLP